MTIIIKNNNNNNNKLVDLDLALAKHRTHTVGFPSVKGARCASKYEYCTSRTTGAHPRATSTPPKTHLLRVAPHFDALIQVENFHLHFSPGGCSGYGGVEKLSEARDKHTINSVYRTWYSSSSVYTN